MREEVVVKPTYRLYGAILVSLSLPCSLRANSVNVTATVKASSAVPFTSFRVYTDNGPDTVTAPPGWTAARVAGSTRAWNLSGGAVPPGSSLTATITVAGNNTPGGSFIGGDYKNAAGNTVWVTTCPDPLSQIVIGAGNSSVNYLGYTIPAGQYGYFYEWWNPAGFGDQTKTANINLGLASGAYNFAVIANSFSVAELSQQQGLQMQGSDATMTAFMDAGSATGTPGKTTGWSFDPTTGIATATFDPGDPTAGLGANEASEIMAFTSAFAPEIGDPNVSAVYISDFPCPGGSTFVPSIPEPGTAMLLALGIGCIAAARLRRSRST